MSIDSGTLLESVCGISLILVLLHGPFSRLDWVFISFIGVGNILQMHKFQMCTSVLNNSKTSKSFVHLLLSLLFPHRNSEFLHIMSPHVEVCHVCFSQVFGLTACKD